jgi:hypothetical protein
MKITGGTGGAAHEAEVNKHGEVASRAASEPVAKRMSQLKGEAYVWTSQDADVDAADTLLAVRNNEARPLYIDKVVLTGGNATSRYEGHVVTATYTSAGTVVNAFNLNTAYSGKSPDVTAHADETGNTQGTVIMDVAVLATTTIVYETPGLILSRNVALAFDQVTESTAGSIQIWGHYED